jgi:hypothetical protein
VVIASQFALFLFPRPNENNRQAIDFMRSRWEASDLLFVHGSMYEQFFYYRRLIPWDPKAVYVGSTQWACCAINAQTRMTSPFERDFPRDLLLAAARVHNGHLWLLLPGATPGHWSGGLRDTFEKIPGILNGRGCQPAQRHYFGQTLVLAFSCP